VTQTQQLPTAAGPPATAAGVATVDPVGAPATGTTTPHSDTVRRLNLHTLGLVLAAIAFGLVGALAFSEQAYSINRAEGSTDQLIRVQDIQTALLSADATATNAFLVGGLEPSEQRASYEDALARTSSLIAEAAEAQPADREALAALNEQVVTYAGTIEQARANNRQGFPIGAQYVRNASDQLRGDALPILDNLVAANSERAADHMDSISPWVFLVVGLAMLGALYYSHRWVSQRFKRRFNVGLSSAAGVVAVACGARAVTIFNTASHVNDIEDGSFTVVNAAAQARISAYDAKSNESLTLISRGSGATFEETWVSSADQVTSSLDVVDDVWGTTSAQPNWQDYVDVHVQIRTEDDNGNWEKAVRLATSDAEGSSNATFATFDDGVSRTLSDASSDTSNGLADAGPILVIGAILMLVVGGLAAAAARWGLAERLKEYR